ncbi:nucleotidyl transferase AbiEii/AbiGii toxin family protein [Desulfovibrio sp. OttesenSCG-928-M14]|nr:nucleotidyl transferase AbiEii/AbiGii toxin family protein [Desulfovibrio sp. OttesenSCG-928-M14]
MATFQPNLTILPEAQREIWKLLTPVTQMGFVLYGGTAVALQLGHRQSVDFDFFSNRSFTRDQVDAILPFLADSTIKQNFSNTYTVEIKNGVQLSFFGGINFGRVGEPLIAADNKIQVASLDDLFATKLKVIFDRAEYKDYKDIAKMLQCGMDLAKGLASARALFGRDFQPAIALKAMTFFEDGDLSQLNAQDKETLTEAARAVEQLPSMATISQNICLSLL